MKNEFNKLDAFMQKHVGPREVEQVSNRFALWPAVTLVMAGLSAFVLWGLIQGQNTFENSTALIETLEWDVTQDEMPDEFEDLIAMVD